MFASWDQEDDEQDRRLMDENQSDEKLFALFEMLFCGADRPSNLSFPVSQETRSRSRTVDTVPD